MARQEHNFGLSPFHTRSHDEIMAQPTAQREAVAGGLQPVPPAPLPVPGPPGPPGPCGANGQDGQEGARWDGWEAREGQKRMEQARQIQDKTKEDSEYGVSLQAGCSPFKVAAQAPLVEAVACNSQCVQRYQASSATAARQRSACGRPKY